MSEINYEATITCPKCGYSHLETMPSDSCRVFYKCRKCGHIMKPKEGDCCVFCSYADKKCPPMQNL
ncbi:MAG: GDCCVxC domain-containing (seleno)protein [Candidatus Methanoperedens sp.]|nr:GDCCVxC domain-containing (seleno)protein [Candidatus Methanoperedens sp.]